MAAAAATLHAFVVVDLPAPDVAFQVPVVVLAVGFAAAEVFVVHLRLGRNASSFSLCEIPLVVGLCFVAPPAVVLARLLGAGGALLWHRRQAPHKLAFNLALFALETVAALIVWHALLGSASPFGPRGWAAALVAMLVVDAIGTVLLSVAIATAEGRRVLETLRHIVGTGPVGVLVNTSGAVVVVNVLVVDWRGAWAVAVVIAVLFLAHRAYLALEQRHNSLEQLNRFTRRVGSELEVEAVARQVLRHLREQLSADRAEIVLGERFAGAALRMTCAADGSISTGSAPAGGLAAAVCPAGDGLTLASRSDRDARVRGALASAGVKDAMVAPLRDEHGSIGTVSVGDRLGDVGTFDGNDLAILEALANHASVALRNARLADELRDQAAASEYEALHDSLTGLANRALFHRELERSVGQGRRVAVALMDLDRFKEINDTLGHQTGDRLLQTIGERLAQRSPGDALVARLGGDEFAVLMRDVGVDEAALAAVRLREALAQPFAVSDMALTVDASTGIAVAPDHGDNAEAILQHADVAMYTAKEAQTGIAVYATKQDRYSPERLTLVTDLRDAVAAGDLALHYQPKLDLAAGRVCGVEALVRWTHPQRGFVPPDEFIPIAEHTGLIDPLTDLVLSSALRQVRDWRQRGAPLTVAVNLSVRTLRDAGFADRLRDLLRITGVPAEALVLEVTESSIMTDPDHTIGVLGRLGELGVGLSIDDLGTGHSSLAYLRRLPVHEVKIDRSFVMGLASSSDDAAIVDAIVELGHRLGKRVVAEGVEDEESLRRLRRVGCDLAQGYLISRPLPADEVLGWLERYARDRRLSAPLPLPA